MNIDNSAANEFRKCPWGYYELYVKGIEAKDPSVGYTPLQLGDRVHQLMEERNRSIMLKKPVLMYKPAENAEQEEESQWIVSSYVKHWGDEDMEIVSAEDVFSVTLPDYCPKCYQLEHVRPWDGSKDIEDAIGAVKCEDCLEWFEPGRHKYMGKIDLLFKRNDKYTIRDYKTQKRGAKTNLPQKWASNDQGTQYIWAATKWFGVEIEYFEVDILQRPSPAGREGPEFPERMNLERTEIQIETALRDLVYTADRIEEMQASFGDRPWPANRQNCYTWGPCEFYTPHLYGWSQAIMQTKFQAKKPYLELKVIQ
jgi:PD-(D/E)XK nuclease superfamily